MFLLRPRRRSLHRLLGIRPTSGGVYLNVWGEAGALRLDRHIVLQYLLAAGSFQPLLSLGCHLQPGAVPVTWHAAL